MVTEIELDTKDFDALDDVDADEDEDYENDILVFDYDMEQLDAAENVAEYMEKRLGCSVEFISCADRSSYLLRITRPGETREPIKRTPKRNNAEIAMIIRKVKAMVQKGWCQGAHVITDGEGRPIARSLVWAIRTVRSELDPSVNERSFNYAYDAIKLFAQGRMNCGYTESVIAYNEAKGRTQQDVVEMLEQVARHTEKGK